MKKKLILLSLLLIHLLMGVVASEEEYKFVRSKYSKHLRSTTDQSITEASSSSSSSDGALPVEENVVDQKNKENEEIVKEDEPDLSTLCGEQTAENHPWIAVLEHTDPNNPLSKKKTLSKGVLISRQHVLTTVSSIHNSHPFWVVSGIRLGDSPTWATNQMLRKREYIQKFDVEEVFIHENRDIAVIKLNKKINITEAVRPICLPRSFLHMEHKELYQHVCKRIKNIPLRESARVVSVAATPLSSRDCHIYFRRKGATLSADEFCAWDESGDSCTGDLGGPLIGKIGGRFYVVGLNSYVLSTREFDDKASPGVYTKISSHLKWIKKVIEADKTGEL